MSQCASLSEQADYSSVLSKHVINLYYIFVPSKKLDGDKLLQHIAFFKLLQHIAFFRLFRDK